MTSVLGFWTMMQLGFGITSGIMGLSVGTTLETAASSCRYFVHTSDCSLGLNFHDSCTVKGISISITRLVCQKLLNYVSDYREYLVVQVRSGELKDEGIYEINKQCSGALDDALIAISLVYYLRKRAGISR